jgi:hypothetical protein
MKLQRDEFKIEHGDLIRAMPFEKPNESQNLTDYYLQ